MHKYALQCMLMIKKLNLYIVQFHVKYAQIRFTMYVNGNDIAFVYSVLSILNICSNALNLRYHIWLSTHLFS